MCPAPALCPYTPSHAMSALLIICAAHLLALCRASCYFSAELQGEYVMQTVNAGAQVQYSQVNITAEAIPMWGQCHQRQEDNVILFDSFNGTACIRCFHLKLHSPNVLQVHTCPTCLDQCYLTEEAARHTCPQGNHFRRNNFKEITLFRTKELGGGNIRKLFCPITGQYMFMYNLFNQTDNRVECSPSLSQLENCPDRARGPRLDIHLQGCSHQYNDMTFECLGDWVGPEGQRFLALYDTSALAGSEYRPQYRCALYKEDEQNGNVMIAFSSDSTCTTDLYNASYGHMTWNLTVVPSPPWPEPVINSRCSFPHWSQGKWEHFVVNDNSLTYKDHLSFNSYTMRCAQVVGDDRFVVFSRNGCGEQLYKCIRLKQRSGNVVEFQLGLASSSTLNHSLCSDVNFLGNVWITQARLEGLQVSPCPVTGVYSGVIPDPNNAGLCAQLASDQMHQEIMYFTVSDCEQQEVYEGRYRSGRHRREVEEGVGLHNITVDEITTTISTSTEKLLPKIGVDAGNVLTSTENPQVSDAKDQDQLSPVSLSSSGFDHTEVPGLHSTTVADTQQVESSVVRQMVLSTQDFNTSNYPVTYRPNRSFQPETSWTSHVSWPPPDTYYRATTLPWYSINSGRNSSSPYYPSGGGGRGYVDFPNNYRDRDWTKSSRPLPVNYWNSGFPREGNVNWPWTRTHNGFYVRPEITWKNYMNKTGTPVESVRPQAPPTYTGNREWTYQNTRSSWNWNGRYRNPIIERPYTYRPYQRSNANGRQPIALPPIQLPPIFTDLRPLQGSSSVDHWSPVREERKYQCLGQWEEDGVTYTYTQRKDFGTYECFVGSIVSNNEIYIKEAGEHCGRGINPMHMGMKLQTKVDTKPPEQTPPVISLIVTNRPSTPTRPWKPITGTPPRHSGNSNTANPPGMFVLLAAAVVLASRC